MFFPSAIKSITQIAVTLGGGVASNTQSVSVTKANSILIFNGCTASSGATNGPRSGWTRGVITSDSVVTVSRGGSSGSVVWYGTLVEFYGGLVKSSGENTITLADTVASGTYTVSPSVVIGKTLLSHTGISTNADTTYSLDISLPQLLTIAFTATNTITTTRDGSVTQQDATVGFNWLELR